jgi:type II secretory pathway predicted ATPase ExeA
MRKQPDRATQERISPATVFASSTGDAVWRGTKQEEALACLTGRTSLKLLLGPASSGKSKILQLLEAESQDRTVLGCSGPQETSLSVLSSLLTSSGFEIWTLSETDQRNLLTVFIEQLSFNDKRVAVCVDDVPDFSDDAWAEIERLTHLKFAGEPLIDLIIAGTSQVASSPPLDRFLRKSTTSQVEAIHFLAPPDGRDLESYIAWRLKRFEIPIRFNPDACAALASKSGGRFGLANLFCQVALWGRDLTEPCEIDEDQIHTAEAKLAELKSSDSSSFRRDPLRAGPNSRTTRNTSSNRLTVFVNGKKIEQLPLNGPLIFGRSQNCDVRAV